MKFAEKNDNGIELHLNVEERELIHKALRHYSGYGEDNDYIMEQMVSICEILNVLDLPEFNRRGI